MAEEVKQWVERGRASLAACDWAEARACFEEAVAREETPEALDGLGQAIYWQGDYPTALELREHAYAGYREAGDRPNAALVAYQLAMLHGLIYGNGAALNGWLGHALGMLEGCGDCREAGWVELFRAYITGDPAEREQHARTAMEAGRRFGDAGLEFDAMGYLGQALIEQGAIEDGLHLVDQAVAAIGALVADPWAAGEIYCSLFHACELVIDTRRADEWLGAVDGYVQRTGELPISAICRMHYGGVLTAAGRWADAERELLASLELYERTYRGGRSEVLFRLAELRALQGRFEEAERLLEGYEEEPEEAGARVRIHLARGEHELAETVAQRHLVHRGRGLAGAPMLTLLVRAKLATGKREEAAEVAGELETLAEACGQTAVRGLAALSHARVATEGGGAVSAYEQALILLSEAGLPYELGRARLELAAVVASEKPETARAEARSALVCFEELGAARDADEAAALLRRLGDRGRAWPKGAGMGLTKRETEVLGLLGEGLTNAEIAERLYISPRTAEDHVGNILSKLGLKNRAEASAHAVRRPPDRS